MTDACELEVKAILPGSTIAHADHVVALQCRVCGAAEIRHVETLGEPFYEGWGGHGDDSRTGTSADGPDDLHDQP